MKVVTEGIREEKDGLLSSGSHQTAFFSLSFHCPSLSPSSFSRVFCSFSGMHFKSERNSQTCFPIHHSGVCPAPDPGNSLSNLNALQRQRVSSIGGVQGGFGRLSAHQT